MGKKSKAPGFAETSYNTDNLFGSSTTNKSGTTYNAPSWINRTMGTVGNNYNNVLQNMLSGDYANDANFKAYQNNLNRQMTEAFDNDVLGQLANRGLMRSSGLQAATNAFNDTLANNVTNLYDSYYNRQAQNLSNLLNTSNAIYNYIAGVNQGSLNTSNAVNQHNLAKYQAENASNGNLFSTLAGAAGGIAGSSLGGGVGSMLGGSLGNLVGKIGGGTRLSGGTAGSDILLA